jgi:N-carbamoyl-L-amino-acid hydrolase
MDRRAFGTVLAGATAGLFTPLRIQAPRQINGERLNGYLDVLKDFGATVGGGISRVAYSEADLAAREFVSGLMRGAGLEVSVDLAGNLLGTFPGTEAGLMPLIIGSHIDSVPEGGNYDGQVGSMAAVEVAQTISDLGLSLRHPLTVVIFQNEEGGKTGSRAWSGEVEPHELDIVTASGKTIRDGTQLLGGSPEQLEEAVRQPGSVAGYLELHIEQGAVLHRASIDIGVVEGIVGIKRWNVTVQGSANHAGTTPMDARQDAMIGAGEFILAANRVARTRSGRQVATVGRIAAFPGAPNVIPGRVELSLEVRDLSMESIDQVFEAIVAEANAIGPRTGTTFDFSQFYVSRAAPTDERFRDWIAASADELGLSRRSMPSGAGHDAQSVALLGPVGMIFVPSVDGISHSPREYTEAEDTVNGANVLLNALLKVDGRV